MDTKISAKDITIKTPRLILRGWKLDDLQDLYEYASVDGTGELAGWKHHENIEVSRGILNLFIEDDEVLAIENRENGKVIGSIGLHKASPLLHDYDDLKMKEVGYVLSRDYWGQGLMTEAVKAIIKYVFENTDIEMLTCGHFVFNDRSKRVIAKTGFHYWYERDYEAKQIGKIYKTKEYYLLKSDYLGIL